MYWLILAAKDQKWRTRIPTLYSALGCSTDPIAPWASHSKSKRVSLTDGVLPYQLNAIAGSAA